LGGSELVVYECKTGGAGVYQGMGTYLIALVVYSTINYQVFAIHPFRIFIRRPKRIPRNAKLGKSTAYRLGNSQQAYSFPDSTSVVLSTVTGGGEGPVAI
jgi:hypothetical protein